jgi:hypothetical protein
VTYNLAAMNAVLQVDGGRLPESCDPKGRHDKNPYESRELILAIIACGELVVMVGGTGIEPVAPAV